MTRRFGLAVAIMLTVLLALAAPSWAHHKSGHSGGAGKPASPGNSGNAGGGGGSNSGSGYTEDNDTNDNGTPNNVVDDGDNAHPSGKDKSVEHGNSGNQGNSSSDPDDDGHGPDRSNGGADKPNGPGGVDLADQDGNNGCGNDDDFEDDNEGWCGKKPKKEKTKPEEKPKDEDDDSDEDEDGDEVLGDIFSGIGVDFGLNGTDDTRVLGESLERNPAAEVAADTLEQPLPREATDADEVAAADDTGALPFTGASIVSFVLLGAALIFAGLLIKRMRVTQ